MRLPVSLAALLLAVPAQAVVTFDWVTVGDPGNPGDPQPDGTFGAVAYEFQIATTETTYGQYAEFLNAVAASDPAKLWGPQMEGLGYGGIRRSGSPGSYTYTVVPGFQDKPVVFVSFYDALRFVNWLHNGQPTGAQGPSTTEDGAYTFTPQGVLDNTITRNPGALYSLPSEDEWHKAAYFGGGSTYYTYPTGTDTPISCVYPTGNDPNAGNCWPATMPTGQLLEVRSYPLTTSPWGAYDMGGNVWEWNEAIIGVERGLRGGSWTPEYGTGAFTEASVRFADCPDPDLPGPGGEPCVAAEIFETGFRVARPLPTGPACGNDVDDDGDLLADLADPGCSSAGDTSEQDPALACDDGLDDDGDTLIDSADPGCADPSDPSEQDPALACDNGLDDDGDTLIDSADPGCAGPSAATESPACDDGVDNDGDVLVDLADPGCSTASDFSEAPILHVEDCASLTNDAAPDHPWTQVVGDDGDWDVCDVNQVLSRAAALTSEAGDATGLTTFCLLGLQTVQNGSNEIGCVFRQQGQGSDWQDAYIAHASDRDNTYYLWYNERLRSSTWEVSGCFADIDSGEFLGIQLSGVGAGTTAQFWDFGATPPADKLQPGTWGTPDCVLTAGAQATYQDEPGRVGVWGFNALDTATPSLAEITIGEPVDASECADGVDNDGDTLTDLLDPGCASAADTSELDASFVCDNGLDDDGDGLADGLDPGCAGPTDLSEQDAALVCDNGLDDDGDSLVDSLDPGCSDPSDPSEQEAGIACDNGLDDDGDGLVDLADPGCSDPADASEQEASLACDNGVDDDGDTVIDLLDAGCTEPGDPSEQEASLACDNGLDDDGDTLADFLDPGCIGTDDDLACDLTGDHVQGGPDVLIVGLDFGCTLGIGNCPGDCTGDGITGGPDVIAVSGGFGDQRAADNSELNPAIECDNGLDDDGDTLVDLADPGCAGPGDPLEGGGSALACDNGLDDDGDGYIDVLDPGCDDANDASEQDAALVCDNGLDDDGDTLVDALDPGCADANDPSETNANLACDNGLDDDGDGLVDLLDPGCSGPGDASEREASLACDNTVDDDGDGLVDLADPGCSDPGDPSEQDPALACDNGLDDDADTFVDLLDPGCTGVTDDSEQDPALACDNGVDDDGDTFADLLDPGCTSPFDPSEQEPSLACDNGLDDDGDTFVDLLDPDCTDPTDPSEAPVTGQFLREDCVELGEWSFPSGGWFAHDLPPPRCEPTQSVDNYARFDTALETLDNSCLLDVSQGGSGHEVGCIFRESAGSGPLGESYVLQMSNRDDLFYFWKNTGTLSDWELTGCSSGCDVSCPYLPFTASTETNMTPGVHDWVAFQLTGTGATTTAHYWNFGETPPANRDEPSTWGAPTCSITAGAQASYVDAPGHAGLYGFQESPFFFSVTLESVDIGDVGAMPPPATCENGLDDDGDGLVDLLDPGCTDIFDTSEQDAALVCDNGLDDDGDTLVDALDPGCFGPADPIEVDPLGACDDGLDNDGDGLLDMADPGCSAPADASEQDAALVCDNGIDDDGDTLADPFDFGCQGPNDPSEMEPGFACDNGIDDDGDTLIDLSDTGCTDPADPSEEVQTGQFLAEDCVALDEWNPLSLNGWFAHPLPPPRCEPLGTPDNYVVWETPLETLDNSCLLQLNRGGAGQEVGCIFRDDGLPGPLGDAYIVQLSNADGRFSLVRNGPGGFEWEKTGCAVGCDVSCPYTPFYGQLPTNSTPGVSEWFGMRLSGTGTATTARFWRFPGGPPPETDNPNTWGPPSCVIDAGGEASFVDTPGVTGLFGLQPSTTGAINLRSVDIGDVGAAP